MVILSIDIALFAILTFIYFKIKKVYPNFLFPIAGLNVYLTPESKDLTDLRKEKENAQKNLNKFQKQKFLVSY